MGKIGCPQTDQNVRVDVRPVTCDDCGSEGAVLPLDVILNLCRELHPQRKQPTLDVRFGRRM